MPLNQESPTLTGSHQRDLACFFFCVLTLILVSPRLRVYCQIAAARVEATLVMPDGKRTDVPIPVGLQKSGTIKYTMDEQLSIIDKRIAVYMEKSQPLMGAPPGARLEWDIHYSFNDPKLDKKKTLSYSR